MSEVCQRDETLELKKIFFNCMHAVDSVDINSHRFEQCNAYLVQVCVSKKPTQRPVPWTFLSSCFWYERVLNQFCIESDVRSSKEHQYAIISKAVRTDGG